MGSPAAPKGGGGRPEDLGASESRVPMPRNTISPIIALRDGAPACIHVGRVAAGDNGLGRIPDTASRDDHGNDVVVLP
eukprot:11920650-Prorocentrum_lima.AAC.1